MSAMAKMARKYGLSGIYNYLKLNLNPSGINVAGVGAPIYLRKGKSDILLFKQIFVYGEYDFKLPGFAPKTIIDAGANIGLSPLYFHSKFPGATIIALEPESENFKMLTRNTAPLKNISCLKAGLWSRSTNLEIVSYDVRPTGFMVKEVETKSEKSIEALSVNDLMSRYKMDTLDFLKLDIEGAEAQVLSENNHWIGRTKVLTVELHDKKRGGCTNAFFNAFAKHNFECHPFGQNFLLINRDLVK
jgi:FkbM family methyltransferase